MAISLLCKEKTLEDIDIYLRKYSPDYFEQGDCNKAEILINSI